MSLFEKSKLLNDKVIKSLQLIELLKVKNLELEERVAKLTQHNTELQVLIEQIDVDNAKIEETLNDSILAIDSIDFGSFEEFSSQSSFDLEQAESFSVDGSSDFEFEALDDIK